MTTIQRDSTPRPRTDTAPVTDTTTIPADVSVPSTILGTRRASTVFSLIVFAATVMQVLATPVSALIEGSGTWPFSVPEPLILGLLSLGCASQALALAFSDRIPEVAVVVSVAVYLALATGLQVPTWLTGMYLVIALSLFLLATRRSTSVSLAWFAIASVSVVGGLLWWMLSTGTPWTVAFWWTAAEAARFGAPAAAATLLGLWWSAKVRRLRAAREAAEEARRQHVSMVAAAQAEERARIAQELHDVAGQHLAGLITLADAALRIAPQQPERALHLIGEVRDEGRFAAASLAGALSDLRATPSDAGSSVDDLRDVDSLLGFWRSRGMQIVFALEGSLANLPAVVSTSAYRCLQEALTNAAKHAPGAPVDVNITVPGDRLIVSVSNGPGTSETPLPGLGLGWGLRGMSERVELLQGTLSTLDDAHGGWHLRFEIPTFATP